jgi:hypothetical protein
MTASTPLALVIIAVAFATPTYAPAFGSDSTPAPLPASSPVDQTQLQASPAPVSPLTPLSLEGTPDPTSTGPYPRLLGHIVASASCSRFVEHYNAAAGLISANDTRIYSADGTLTRIADDYYRRDGALRAYEHRQLLIDNVSQMQNSIPAEQRAVNDMLAQAKDTKNAARQAALQESASQLQKSVDHQRALAYDLSNLVHVLMDKHGYEDTFAGHISPGLPPVMSFNLNPGDNPIPQPGDGPLLNRSAPPKNQTTAQEGLHYDQQTSTIAAAETKAASAATRVVTICRQDSYGTPGGPTLPLPTPSP